MKKVKVLLSFKTLSVPKKIVFGRNVIEEMQKEIEMLKKK